jgi:hypothetical protein
MDMNTDAPPISMNIHGYSHKRAHVLRLPTL